MFLYYVNLFDDIVKELTLQAQQNRQTPHLFFSLMSECIAKQQEWFFFHRPSDLTHKSKNPHLLSEI